MGRLHMIAMAEGAFGTIVVIDGKAVKTIDTENKEGTNKLLNIALGSEDNTFENTSSRTIREVWLNAIRKEVRLQNLAADAGISPHVDNACWMYNIDDSCPLETNPPKQCARLRARLEMTLLANTFEDYSLHSNLMLNESVKAKPDPPAHPIVLKQNAGETLHQFLARQNKANNPTPIEGKITGIDGNEVTVNGAQYDCSRVKRQYAYIRHADAKRILHLLTTLDQLNIYHADWKPANVMCDHTGRWFVIDFGWSRDQMGGGNFKTAKRTIPKWAPAVPDDEPGAEARNDVHRYFKKAFDEGIAQEERLIHQMQPDPAIFQFKLRL